jgi:hypothetical protein
VFTDSVAPFNELFADRALECVPVSAEQIKDWKGKIDFVHRLKIKVMQDFFERYQGDVIYLDSDTCFTQNIESLWQSIATGHLLMHTREGKVSSRINPVFKKLARFLSLNTISLKDGSKLKIPPATDMWNAGALGLTPAHKPLLDKVLLLTDSMYPVYPKHIVEQFAFSYYFQQEATVLPAEDCIYHYWNFKEFRGVLSDFFERYKGMGMDTMLQNMHRIEPIQLSKAKVEFKSLSKTARFFRKLKVKNGWRMPAYEP